jgi:hypothetical protein
VVTSLIEAESRPKGYGIFEINEMDFSFELKYLEKSVRPFIFL